MLKLNMILQIMKKRDHCQRKGDKKAKGTKTCVIKTKLKFENHKKRRNLIIK